MKVVLNAVAAKMGGAPNYIRHVARELAASGAGEFIFILPTELAEELRPKHPRLRFIGSDAGKGSLLRRMWFDQVEVRALRYTESSSVRTKRGSAPRFFLLPTFTPSRSRTMFPGTLPPGAAARAG